MPWLIVYFIVALLQLIAEWYGISGLQVATKPLLMPVLILVVLRSMRHRSTTRNIVIAALFFSWIGDILLMSKDDELFFMLGLSSFLIAHVNYIVAYNKLKHHGTSISNFLKFITISLLLIYGVVLISMVYANLGAMRFPVLVYAAVILTMGYAAAMRYGLTPPGSFQMVMAGALIFIVSDSLIAINMFSTPLQNAGFWIMLTYITGQGLIVRGITRHY